LAKILSSFRSDWKALAETISEEIENNEIEFTSHFSFPILRQQIK